MLITAFDILFSFFNSDIFIYVFLPVFIFMLIINLMRFFNAL